MLELRWLISGKIWQGRLENFGFYSILGSEKVQVYLIFSEDCPKNILVPYLPQIMEKLESVLKVRVWTLEHFALLLDEH